MDLILSADGDNGCNAAYIRGRNSRVKLQPRTDQLRWTTRSPKCREVTNTIFDDTSLRMDRINCLAAK